MSNFAPANWMCDCACAAVCAELRGSSCYLYGLRETSTRWASMQITSLCVCLCLCCSVH
jgi:hypothetical protein